MFINVRTLDFYKGDDYLSLWNKEEYIQRVYG